MTYEQKLQQAELHAEKQKQKLEIQKIKHKNDKQKKPLSYSKLALIFILTNCTIIEIYAMVVMFMFRDLSALIALITAVVTESISLCAYFAKASVENRANGITYETAMRELDCKTRCDEEEVVG